MGGTRTARGACSAVLVAGAVVAGSVAVGAAPPPPVDTSALCAEVPDGFGGFELAGNEDDIECLTYAEITTGVPGGGYDPSGVVTRAQMATFIARLLDTVAELDRGSTDLQRLPSSGPDAFTDDDGLQPHEANIDRLAVAGIVAGSGGGDFRPGEAVTRGQMATFVNNAQNFLTGSPFTSTEDFFTDDDGNTHEANINAIAAAGVAQGVGGDRYAPSAPVTRSQMASFLVRDLSTLHAAGAIDALPAAEPVGGGFVDGAISAFGETCTWTDATTSARPPDTLDIDAASVVPPEGNATCTTGELLEIDLASTVTFDDGAGTATLDEFHATGIVAGLECRYRIVDAVLGRDGATRRYAGTVQPILVSGDASCPATFDLAAELTFR